MIYILKEVFKSYIRDNVNFYCKDNIFIIKNICNYKGYRFNSFIVVE